jgi:hypothetical protein
MVDMGEIRIVTSRFDDMKKQAGLLIGDVNYAYHWQ